MSGVCLQKQAEQRQQPPAALLIRLLSMMHALAANLAPRRWPRGIKAPPFPPSFFIRTAITSHLSWSARPDLQPGPCRRVPGRLGGLGQVRGLDHLRGPGQLRGPGCLGVPAWRNQPTGRRRRDEHQHFSVSSLGKSCPEASHQHKSISKNHTHTHTYKDTERFIDCGGAF